MAVVSFVWGQIGDSDLLELVRLAVFVTSALGPRQHVTDDDVSAAIARRQRRVYRPGRSEFSAVR